MVGRRRPARPVTVRAGLTLVAAVVVGVGLIAGGAVVLVLVRHDLQVNVRNEALNRARTTASQLAVAELPATLPSTGDDATLVQVVDRSGGVVAASEELRGAGPLLTRRPEHGTFTTTLRDAPTAEGSDYTVVAMAVPREGAPLTVYAASSLEPVGDGVGATATALGVVVPVLLIVVTGTAWLLVGRTLKPVEAIRRQVAEITVDELDRRVPESGTRDEVDRLAHTMNEMLDRLEQAHERQRRFVSDASHELRSPLTTIRTRLEVGLAHPSDTDWRRLAQTVHREATRLGNLADDLLLLSRSADGPLDASAPRAGPDRDRTARAGETVPRETEPVDLDEIVLLEVEAIRARSTVRIDLSPFSGARLRGRPEELRRVVSNLLDNAERHARSAVTIGLVAEDGMVDLIVADDGDGIPPEHAEAVFERFFRLEPARDRDSGGAGLGLAIVHDVVTRHGGHVRVAPTAVGAEFHVRLPQDAGAHRRRDG